MLFCRTRSGGLTAAAVVASALTLSAFAPRAAEASVLSDYNLIVLGDYNANGGAVIKKSFFGGNVNGSNNIEFGRDFVGSDVSTYVAGNIAPGYNLKGGLRFGGSDNSPYRNNNGTGTIAHDPGVPAMADAIEAELKSLNTQLADLANTVGAALTYTDMNRSTFTYGGSDSMVVLNLTAAQLTASTSLFVNLGTASTLIVNVTDVGAVNLSATGLDASTFGGFGETNILWNFAGALQLTSFRNQMKGTILAPWANLNADGASEYDGTVAVASVTGGSRQYHDFVFTGELPPPDEITGIPAPAALPAGLALMGLGLTRRHRR